tara:strand:- start:559 stop:1482 length:924 start_codon:yes stop_codon:yes gene_type:complete
MKLPEMSDLELNQAGSRPWGIDNDYTQLRDVLLGRPDYYRWVEAGPIIGRTLNNADKTGVKFDHALALEQHRNMVQVYEDAGVNCHYLDADPVLHRNFFARDSSAMTPWGALICHMQLKCRRADYVTAIDFYQSNNIPIWKMSTAGHFEGGDFVILKPGLVLVGYCGERSEREGAEQVAAWVGEEGWEAIVVPNSREFVHMDGLVVPIGPNLLVTCLDALEDWLIDRLKAEGYEFVNVGYGEARNLGVNLVALGKERILSMASSPSLNSQLSSLGYEVHAPDMSMFVLGGGGVHCLCQSLYRDPASP